MHQSAKKIRLFVAIPIPLEFEDALNQFKINNSQVEDIRWIAFKNLHLTMHFIGAVNKQEVNPLIKVLSTICSQTKSFSLKFKSYELAPTKKTRMLWATYINNESFIKLSQALNNELAYLRKADHLPLAHITLARSKKYLVHTHLQSAEPLPELPVNQLILWQSLTLAKGAEYIPLQTFSLLDE